MTSPVRRIVLVDEHGLHRIMTRFFGNVFPEQLLGGAVVLARVTDRALYYTPNPAMAPALHEQRSEEK